MSSVAAMEPRRMAFGELAPGVVARAARGDEEAFHLIFNRYGRPILSFINNQCRIMILRTN
jgi:hypothetical protein